jgi:hypothetical protein
VVLRLFLLLLLLLVCNGACSWDRSATDISSCAEVERVVLENKGRLAARMAGGELQLIVL